VDPAPNGREPTLLIPEIRNLDGGVRTAEAALVAQQAMEGMGWSAVAAELVG